MIVDYLLLALAAFLFGFFLGKRLGREEGREEGQALVRLLLREKSFAQGYCALCRAPALPRERDPA
jgi:hypothetical protein